MMIARCFLLAATIATLTAMGTIKDPPRPKPVQVDYCWITYNGGKMRIGPRRKKTLWWNTYGPCSLLDRYEIT